MLKLQNRVGGRLVVATLHSGKASVQTPGNCRTGSGQLCRIGIRDELVFLDCSSPVPTASGFVQLRMIRLLEQMGIRVEIAKSERC